MDKFTVMQDIEIYIFLLALISVSATAFTYALFKEYTRFAHARYIKNIILGDESDSVSLLRANTQTRDEKSLLARIESIMMRAGFHFPLYLFFGIFVTAALFVGTLMAFFLKHWSGYLFGVPFGILLVAMIVDAIIRRRKKLFNRMLATSISVLVKMMKNGIGFEQALVKSVSVSSSEFFRTLFQNFFQEKNTIGEEEAFKNLNKLVNSKELLIFALAIKIGRASGGQFANTLEKVEQTISYRKKMQEKVDVITREGSVGSYIVVGIAIFLYFSLDGNFDGKLHAYFMNSEYGRFQLLGIWLWVFIGMFVNKLITKVDK